MALRKVDIKALDRIVERMIDTVDHSKDEIFMIGEQCRKDYDSIFQELKEIKENVKKIIDEGNILDIKVRLVRQRLSGMSRRRLNDFSEQQVKETYDYADELQTKLTVKRKMKQLLRKRRDDLERRLIQLEQTINRADFLLSQMTFISKYLESDMKEMSETLEDTKIKQEYGFRIIEAQEEERKRLSREIHDGPAQLLASVLIRSDIVEKMYHEKSPEKALKEIRDLKGMIREALQEVRRIIYDLRPTALDDLGLIPTLKKYLATMEEFHKVTEIKFIFIGQERRLPSKYEVAIFRLVQESVHNALKHAKAKTIQVKIKLLQEMMQVVVQDDGIGFEQKDHKCTSLGMISMKERVDILNGTFTVYSKPGEGTINRFKFPLPK